jgi:hypothetical protein
MNLQHPEEDEEVANEEQRKEEDCAGHEIGGAPEGAEEVFFSNQKDEPGQQKDACGAQRAHG